MVAPFAGAWIEIKSKLQIKQRANVAPFAGAWIEIKLIGIDKSTFYRRSLRGSVD